MGTREVGEGTGIISTGTSMLLTVWQCSVPLRRQLKHHPLSWEARSATLTSVNSHAKNVNQRSRQLVWCTRWPRQVTLYRARMLSNSWLARLEATWTNTRSFRATASRPPKD